MSHVATNWALRQRGLKPATKILLFCLADCHNPHHGCFPSQERLADDAELSERSVRTHIEELERRGLIRREAGPRRNGTFPVTRYILGFEGFNLASEDPATGKSCRRQDMHSPAAKSAGHHRQNLPTNSVIDNPVIEPSKSGTQRGLPLAGDDATDKPPPKRRMTADWMPSDGIAFPLSLGFSEQASHDELEDFRIYWIDRRDRDGSKSDAGWSQCWKNHCKRAAGRSQPRSVARGPHPARGQQQAGILGAFARREAARGR